MRRWYSILLVMCAGLCVPTAGADSFPTPEKPSILHDTRAATIINNEAVGLLRNFLKYDDNGKIIGEREDVTERVETGV
jgi:hypothetical protein